MSKIKEFKEKVLENVSKVMVGKMRRLNFF